MIRNEDNQHPLPSGWLWTKLDEVVERISNGITQKQTKNREGMPVTRIETISNGVIDLTRVGYLRDLPPEIAEKYRLSLGDILFSHINSDMHLGKTAIFDIEGYTLLHGMNLLLIRPNKQILVPDFLNYLFNHYRSSGVFISIAQHAVNQSSINQTKMKGLLIPLAPFGEQVRIVARLEELFARLDAGVKRLRKVKAQLKRYRQAVLKYAFEGKLTEEWRKTHKPQLEPATKLLQQIKQQRKDIHETKSKMPQMAVSGLLESPEGWAYVKLGELITFEYGKGLRKDRRDPHGSFPVYGSNGVVGYHSASLVTKPCIVVGRKGAVGAVHLSKTPCWPIDTTYYVIAPEGLDLSFLYYLLSTLKLDSLDKSTAIPGLNRNDVYSLIVPIPPRLEQEQIVKEIDQSFSLAEVTEKVTKQSIKQSERLRQSILKTAFKGKLVPQDPNDEPAEKLLERIREERAKSEGEKDINKKKIKPKQLELSTYVE
jgi:type I restriction enzyme S subunit